VAVGNDKCVLLGSNSPAGIYRFTSDSKGLPNPLLPQPGGVACDTATLKWAATQPPNEIVVFEGQERIRSLKLPPNKSIYRQGLLSFGPAGKLVVATRPSDAGEGGVWLLQFETDPEKEGLRSLFPWERERMVDFAVGPRMYWERHEPNTYRSIY
jgi:hypothetical protein